MSWLDNIVINLGPVQGSTMDLIGLDPRPLKKMRKNSVHVIKNSN